MARPKSVPTLADIEKLTLPQIRALLADAAAAQKKKAKAEREQEAKATEQRERIAGRALLASFPEQDLGKLLRKIIPAQVKDPGELALFERWLKAE